MPGIRLVNIGEYADGLFNLSTTVPPHAGSATAVIARIVARCGGFVRIVGCPAGGGALGNSTDHKQVLRVLDRGFTGAVTAVIVTNDAVLKDANAGGVGLPADGTPCIGTSNGVVVKKGTVLEIQTVETGSVGTGTRTNFNILDAGVLAAGNIDAASKF